VQSFQEKLGGITGSFAFFIPELLLVLAIIMILLAGLFDNKRNFFFNALTFTTAITSAVMMLTNGSLQGHVILFNGMMQRDGFGAFLMVLVDVALALTCLMSLRKKTPRHLSEYYVLLLSAGLGSHLLLMSTNLAMVFLSIELISIPSYILAGYSFDRPGSEGSLKYFLFGSISSAIMLYGFSILYGLTGTLAYNSPHFFSSLIESGSPLVLIAGIMSLAGFLFKIAATPMHVWAPDVYEAAPIPVIAFLSVVPKLAGIGILTKFVLAMHLFGQSEFDWQLIVSVISILTLTFGNLSALWQKNAKRMMAYSSIAQSGFLLVGIAAFLPQGLNFMLFYATVYLLMNFAVFLYLDYFEGQGITSLEGFSGAGKRFIWPSVGLTIGLIALTGLPPTAGFTAKLFVFSGVWQAYETSHKALLLWLLIFGLLNTVISLFYYLRIPYFAFIRPGGSGETSKKVTPENLLAGILVVIIVVLFFMPGMLMGLINRINFVL
jgi:NADH-quinone oxidoreductase subunit N